MPTHDIIVVGASAGGVDALKRVATALPGDLPASVFVVLHIAPDHPSYLPSILQRDSPLKVLTPNDGDTIQARHLYVAPPDRHMLLERDRVRVVRGPKENRHRPAVDPLFRSAAWVYGPRVVGVVLSGTLDDGAVGLWAVKTCGGVTIVQDPAEAAFAEMPQSAMNAIDVEHCLPLDEIVRLLPKLARTSAAHAEHSHRPESLKIENELVMLDRISPEMNKLGPLSVFTCPACHGALWEVEEGGLLNYRCHTGHAFAADSLLAEQSEVVEEALYSAFRALREQATACRRIASRFAAKLPRLQARYEAEARQLDERATILIRLVSDHEVRKLEPLEPTGNGPPPNKDAM